ncbi:uncharacterized protein EHS24_000608 [Apiotrichum porosum]|uniref:Uncharacterized protein n=1 Tax=Apiotrichum porosum TaxID=105984 RepID=A0A427YA96_9TREE|nr:uncharacterized protein EHS24_000608 [Apiotrichum porosum]RSH88081.1 hypothetical protein EHS24_000608 [Apiotrichum porosum]
MAKLPWGVHVLALFLFCFVGFVLSILITFSTPFIPPIAFLTAPTNESNISFGAFGWCSSVNCSNTQLAYEYSPYVNKSLTGAMFLWPIGSLLMLFTVLSILPLLLVHEAPGLRFVGNKPFFLLSSILAAAFVGIGWLFSLFGWNIARRSYAQTGVNAQLGPAVWMGLVAALFIIGVVAIGWPDVRYERPDHAYERAPTTNGNVVQTTTTRRVVQQPSPPIVERVEQVERPLPQPAGTPVPPGDGYYHYKRTTHI